MEKEKELNILGTKYKYIETDNNFDKRLGNLAGITLYPEKTLLINLNNDYKEDIERIKRHEILHAFIREAGLEELNKEIFVDFLAHQMPKLQKLFDEVM